MNNCIPTAGSDNRGNYPYSTPMRALQGLLILLAVAALAACGGSSGAFNNSISAGSLTDQQAFARTVYPLMRGDARCLLCHAGSGVGKPDFAHQDESVAYSELVNNQKVNLFNPASSRIVQRLRNDNHNCWSGAANCAANADAMQKAIQDWATLTGGGAQEQIIASAPVKFSDATTGHGAARADDTVIALYEFSAGSGDTVFDVSEVGAAMDLTISGDMEWIDGGGLRNVAGSAMASTDTSRKLFEMIAEGNDEYTVEAWIIPDNLAQDGPARIVSYSRNGNNRNFTAGQVTTYYNFRNRSADLTNNNGTPGLVTDGLDVQENLQHVVFTLDQTNGRRVYVDGEYLGYEDAQTPGELNWDPDYNFILGDEVNGGREWLGTYLLVAIHNSALTPAQIRQNFEAGVAGTKITLSFDISDVTRTAGTSINMDVRELDGFSYLFVKPTFKGPAGLNIPVRDIRIAVNNRIPVAAQAFRGVNTTITEASQELSEMGSVIPKDLGAEDDSFYLAFAALGDQSVTVTEPGPRVLPRKEVDTPAVGLRIFSQINDTMATLTGVDPDTNAVRNTYRDIRQQLPATSDPRTFVSSQQMSVQKLALEYCSSMVNSGALRDEFFNNNYPGAIDGLLDKAIISEVLYDKLIGINVANQPDKGAVLTELVSLIDDLGCANGCDNARTRTVTTASCAAVLSSAAVTIN